MTDAIRCCPACSGRHPLRALDPHLGFTVPLRRCDRCLGIWANHETVVIARRHYHAKHYVMVEGHGRQRCRGCNHLLPRGGRSCKQCKADQRIHCAQCERPMSVVLVAGVTLDICKPCQAVWFDRGELGLVARAHARELGQRLSAATNVHAGARTRSGGSDAGAELVSAGGDLVDLGVGIVHGAHAAGELAVGAVEQLPAGLGVAAKASTAAGETVVESASAAGELATGAAKALLELLGGIFD